MRVLLRAERLSKAYPSHDKLLFGRGKRAFAYDDGGEDDEIVFGSKEGEYCLLRIRVENSQAGRPLPLGSIVDVQMLYQSGLTVNLKTAEQKGGPYRREVVVLLEPETLLRRVTSGSPADIGKAVRRDARFQLHIRIALGGTDRVVDISKTLSWRTVLRSKALLRGPREAGLEAPRCTSHVIGSGFRFLCSKAASFHQQVKKASHCRAVRRQRTRSSEMSWRASF